MSERESDPFGAHRFRVRCDVLPDLGFTDVRGLSVSVVRTDDADVDADDAPARPPGRRSVWEVARGRFPAATLDPPHRETTSPLLELTRGVTDDLTLWTWLHDWVAGDVDPQDVRVCLLDGQSTPVRGWVCREATPVRWTGPTLVAERATVATETLELAHQGIDAVTDLSECADR